MAKRYTTERVKSIVELEGYELLEPFKTVHDKLQLRCWCGRLYAVRFKNWLHLGHRCSHGKKEQLTYDLVKQKVNAVGYVLLSTEYTGANELLKMWCGNTEHKPYFVKYGDFQQGHRCPMCNGGVSFQYDIIKKRIEENDGYELISTEYINSSTKLDIKCPNEHIFKMRWNDFQQGHRCPTCFLSAYRSKAEAEITEWIHQHYPHLTVINNDRTHIVNPLTNRYLELDIWLPELNKAIEFNGIHWHSGNYAKYKDSVKANQCETSAIPLFIVEESAWMDDKAKCFSALSTFLKC